MLYNVDVLCYDSDFNLNRVSGFTVYGMTEAISYAVKILRAYNVICVDIVNAFTGEVEWSEDKED